MDFISDELSSSLGGGNKQPASTNQQSGGLMSKLNNMGGGGQAGEQNEDPLDKGVDFVQERFLGQGPQDNESAVEQAKDERISDAVRKGFKSVTGRDVPVRDT